MDRSRVSFGIKTSQANTTYAEILRIWREADAIPAFEHAWLWDHLVPLRGEVTGPASRRGRCSRRSPRRPSAFVSGSSSPTTGCELPAVLAKMAATVDIISGGRLEFGIGAGGSAVPDPVGLAMVHRELDAYGIDVVSPGEAIGALGEACTIIKRMWTEDEPFDFDGRYYTLAGAICEPKPVQRPHPPILIGGAANGSRSASSRSMPTSGTARHGSAWRNSDTRALSSTSTVRRSVAILRRSSARCRSSCRGTRWRPAAAGGALPSYFGPVAAREFLLALIDAGARHLVLAPVSANPSAQWLADEIVEPVLAATA